MSLQILYLHYILYILSRFYINCMCSNGAKCNNCSKRKNLTSIISKMFWINYAFVEINYMYIQLQMPCMHGSSSSIIELLRESTIYTDDIHERKLYHHGDGSFASFNYIENRSNCWLIDQLLTKFSPIIDNYRTKNDNDFTFCRLTMLMLWLPPCILDRIRNTASDRTCIWDPALNKEYVYVIASIGHHIPFIILLFCYVKVLIVVRRRQRRVVALQPSTNQTHNDENEAVNDQSAPVSITCDPRTTVPCQSQNDGSGLEVPIIKPRTNTDSTEQRRNSQETSNRTANSTKKSRQRTEI